MNNQIKPFVFVTFSSAEMRTSFQDFCQDLYNSGKGFASEKHGIWKIRTESDEYWFIPYCDIDKLRGCKIKGYANNSRSWANTIEIERFLESLVR